MSPGGDDDAPWRSGVDAAGVRPPGRRLDDASGRRSRAWSASGVEGVTPPGRMPLDRRPKDLWTAHQDAERAAARKAMKLARRLADRGRDAETPPPLRPVAGYQPQGHRDTPDLRTFPPFFEEVKVLLGRLEWDEETVDELAMVIRQSSSPFEILVAFAALTAAVEDRKSLRRQHGRELERGIDCYFNLLTRMGLEAEVPDGFDPDGVDSIFSGLPDSAVSLPFAHAVAALEQLHPFVDEDDPECLVPAACRRWRDVYITGRSFGDRSLEAIFPPPSPAPDSDASVG